MGKGKIFLIKNGISIALISLIFGIIIILFFTLFKPFNNWSCNLSSELLAQYGNFIGGSIGTLFSFITLIFLYATLVEQSTNNKKQSFENTFFNLLKTQQEISNNINAYFYNLDDSFDVKKKQIIGKEFFLYSTAEIMAIEKSFSYGKYLNKYDKNDIERYLHEIEEKCSNSDSNENKRDDYETYKQEIRFMHTNQFYGISEEIFNEFKSLNNEDRISKLYQLFYSRYRYAIGHYFRHLYHIILFVKENKLKLKLNEFEGKKYIDFIQAQMSSFELTLLYYNSLIFPKMKDLIIEFNLLENLYEDELIKSSLKCIKNIVLKK